MGGWDKAVYDMATGAVMAMMAFAVARSLRDAWRSGRDYVRARRAVRALAVENERRRALERTHGEHRPCFHPSHLPGMPPLSPRGASLVNLAHKLDLDIAIDRADHRPPQFLIDETMPTGEPGWYIVRVANMADRRRAEFARAWGTRHG